MALIRLPAEKTTLTEFEGVRSFLATHGIDYEKWTPEHPVDADATSEAILDAYGRELETLKARGGYRTADVIDVRPNTPNLDAMLAKFSRLPRNAETATSLAAFTTAGMVPPVRAAC